MKSNNYKSVPVEQLEVFSPTHEFGGSWTSEKLERLKKYLDAYVKVLKDKKLRTIYVDAFAGSGDVKLVSNQGGVSSSSLPLFPDLQDEASERLIEGSARVALQVNPSFHRYLFIEKKNTFVRDLEDLKEQFPERKNLIHIVRGDANEVLCDFCERVDWKGNRAVVFLDPYGMQVKWETLEKIAETQAIDLWYLFPLGVGVSRLLKNDGQISETHRLKLDDIFGTTLWRDAFYKVVSSSQTSLFDKESSRLEKTADFDSIEEFFVRRLKTVFPFVAEKPYRMLNSKGNPLYSFCFAAGNPKGGKIALKIANHILKR